MRDVVEVWLECHKGARHQCRITGRDPYLSAQIRGASSQQPNVRPGPDDRRE